MTIRLTNQEAERLGFQKRSERTKYLDKLDLILDEVCTARGLQVYSDFAFAQELLGRLWKIDRIVPKLRLGFEYEGAAGFGSRHTTPAGFAEDAEKYAAATILGWTVMRIPPKMLEDRLARILIEALMRVRLADDSTRKIARQDFAHVYRDFHERRTAAQKLRKGKLSKRR